MDTHNNPTGESKRPQRRRPKRPRRGPDPIEGELDDDFLNEALAALHRALHKEPPALCRLCLVGLSPPAPAGH